MAFNAFLNDTLRKENYFSIAVGNDAADVFLFIIKQGCYGEEVPALSLLMTS